MRLEAASLQPPSGLDDLIEELGDGESGFLGDSVRLGPSESLPAYLQRLVDNAKGVDLPPGMVPETTFWLLDDADSLVGTTRLRHLLNESWLAWGGHIAYYVRPGARGLGYGREALRLTLDEARKLEITRVLLTVLVTNKPSLRVVAGQGGQREDERVHEPSGARYRRFWIDLAR